MHLDSKFHYKNSKHVSEGASVPLPSLCCNFMLPSQNTQPTPCLYLSSPIPLTYHWQIYLFLNTAPTMSAPLRQILQWLPNVYFIQLLVLILALLAVRTTVPWRQAGLLLLVVLGLFSIFFCLNTVSPAIHPWPGHFKSRLLTLWSDTFSYLCESSCSPVSIVVT